jgi:glycosyltransferase involved in cell wall biosynthesis
LSSQKRKCSGLSGAEHSLSTLVTIAIPTFNRAGSYLPYALQCALSQSYPNLEIIVADNCSPDVTETLVANIGDPRLRYVRHESNIGANGNFNFCVEQAKGKYLLLLHDDDMIDPDFVTCCMQAADGCAEPGIIRTGVRLIDDKGKVIRDIPNRASGLDTTEFFRAWFSGKTALYLCSILFHTKKLKEVGGLRSRHNCYDDGMAEFRLVAKYGRIDVPDVKASFRMHKDQRVFLREIDEWCEDSLDLLHLIRELAPENKDVVFREGLRFFAGANYRRARMAASPAARLLASIKVLTYFKFRKWPSLGHVVAILYGTRLYAFARQVKRRWQYASSQA